MAQYFQYVVQNVDDLKKMYPHLNLENCVVMNEDGTQFGSQPVLTLAGGEPLVMDSNQLQQIIYQPTAQATQLQPTETSTQYIIQEDDATTEVYNNLVNQQQQQQQQQQQPQQVFYTEIPTENGGTQLIQHHGPPTQLVQAPHLQNTIDIQQQQQQQQQQVQQVQAQQSPVNQNQHVVIQQYRPQPQQQQILLTNNAPGTPQTSQIITLQNANLQNVVLRQPQQIQNSPFVYEQQQPTAHVMPQQLQQAQQIQQIQTQQIQAQPTIQQIQTQLIRKMAPNQVVKQRFVARAALNQMQPQKMMQTAGIQAQIIQPQIRCPAPNQIRLPAPRPLAAASMVRMPAARPRANTYRPRAPAVRQPNVRQVTPPFVPNVNQQQAVVRPQRYTLSRSPQQRQVITSTVATSTPMPTQNVSTKSGALIRNVTAQYTKAAPTVQVAVATTTTDSLTEDLEESITAAKISKQQMPQHEQIQQSLNLQQQLDPPPLSVMRSPQDNASDDDKLVTLNNGRVMSLADYKRLQKIPLQQQLQTPPQLANQQLRPMIRGSAPIRARVPRFTSPSVTYCTPPRQPIRRVIDNSAQNQLIQTPIHASPEQQQIEQIAQQQTPVQQTAEVRESARMLVILQSGEQRLITFTLPKESCTVQELLEQVGVQFEPDTNIQCIPNPGVNIDYLVTVGVHFTETPSEIIQAAETSLQTKMQQQVYLNQIIQQQPPQQQLVQTSQQQNVQTMQKLNTISPSPPNQTGVPKQSGDPPPRYITGMYGLCTACGYSSTNHAQCQRCRRIFTEDPKKIPMSVTPVATSTPKSKSVGTVAMITTASTEKIKRDSEIGSKKVSISPAEPKVTRPRKTPNSTARSRAKAKQEEPVILTLSSDEEDENATNNASQSLSQSENTTLLFEPTIKDDISPEDFLRDDISNLQEYKDALTTSFHAKFVYFGTYRFEPQKEILFTSRGIRIYAPNVKRADELIALNFHRHEIIRMVYHFSNPCVIFLYVLSSCAKYARESIEMDAECSSGYFSSFSENSTEKRITIQLDSVTEATKSVIKSIFPSTVPEEIKLEEAQPLLDQVKKAVNAISSTNGCVDASNSDTNDIRRILIYPPSGKGGISINTEDYMCLGIDQYLNDVIIDFYLKYVLMEHLTEKQREKTHVFSTFFYKRLTTLNTKMNSHHNKDVKLTPAQKRHERVKNWTKNVNLFEKDFIVIPINEQSHWFLAIICYPALKGPVTMDGNVPVKPLPLGRKKVATVERKPSVSLQIGSTTITPVSAKKEPDAILLDEESERDEAEGDESELASEDSDEEPAEPKPSTDPIKQPCILLFDSLAGAARSRVVATLRDYLTCEYRVKVRESTNHTFTKFNIPGHTVKVPQQTNFTDCGLYLLQYVEQFFKDPVKDYRLPIKQLTNWFEAIIVTKKREDICNLIKELMTKYNRYIVPLPDIQLPTENGKLIELPDFTEEHGDFEEDEEELNLPEESASQKTTQTVQEPVLKKKILIRKTINNGTENKDSATKKRRIM